MDKMLLIAFVLSLILILIIFLKMFLDRKTEVIKYQNIPENCELIFTDMDSSTLLLCR